MRMDGSITRGAADDARDADGLSVFKFDQAQQRARSWFHQIARQLAGQMASVDHAYTVADAMPIIALTICAAVARLPIGSIGLRAAWVTPEMGAVELAKLSKMRIVAWHQKIAELPARLRTKSGQDQKHREADTSPEGIRRRR